MATWANIKSLAIFFGPLLLPRAIAFYRSARAAPTEQGLPIRPVPATTSRGLAVLFVAAVAALLLSLPVFAPDNVFALTKSRVQAPNDVLFARLASLRPGGVLAAADDVELRGKLASLDARLLYLKYGPAAVTDCAFCAADDPLSYFYFALPGVLAPHLANVGAAALATSARWAGGEAARWRAAGTLAAIVVGGLDVCAVYAWDYRGNARTTRAEDVRAFFWSMRAYRWLAIAGVDALLGWVVWLSATNRAFGVPPAPAERVESVTRVLEVARSKLNATGIVRNSVIRDEPLRARSNAYWAHEVSLMGQVMEEREVVESVNNALGSRIDVDRITADAEAYSQNVLGQDPEESSQEAS